MFARDIGRGAWGPDQPPNRCGVNNGAAPLLEHLRELVLQAQPDTLEVDAEDVVPDRFRVVVDRKAKGFYCAYDTRVVVGAVQATVGLDSLLDQRLHLGCLGDIRFDKESLPTGIPNHLRCFFATSNVDIRDDNLGALPGKGERRRFANAAAAVSDESDLAEQPFRHGKLLLY